MTQTGPHWFSLQFARGQAQSVILFAQQLEIECFIPIVVRRFVRRNRTIEFESPLYGVYGFVRFDPFGDPKAGIPPDPWGHLMHSKGRRAGIVKVMGEINDNGVLWPVPVPDRQIELARGYTPSTEEDMTKPHRFKPGEPCVVLRAGHRQIGTFDCYLGETRQFVRTWIFGAERKVEVTCAEIEPLNLDNPDTLTANSAA